MKIVSLIAVATIAFMLPFGCTKARKAGGQMDTPEFHYELGMKYYNENDFKRAEDEFNLATSMDKKFAPAWSGLALCEAEKGAVEQDADKKDDFFEKAID